MAELTHDTAEDGFHEIQLSGKQLVFLFMTATVVSVVIFLCGVLVGRGVRANLAEEPIDSAVAVTAPPPATTTPDAAAPAAAEPPAPPAEDELTYHKRLEGGATPEKIKPQAAQSEEKPKPQVTPPPPATAPPAPAAAAVPTSGRPGRWVVQVTALRNRAAAAEIVQSLIGKGYPAFLLSPGPGAPPLYRIQIGRYNDRTEAEQIARRLAKEEQFKPDIKR